MEHLAFIIFVFALGACVGSFLNVVVWRLPRNESLVSPPSHCPKCNTKLAWYDNIPVFGWLALRGKCRYCGVPISPRYPIVEAITGGLFVLYYVAFFIFQQGPCADRALSIQQDWPMWGLYLFMISGLLASSLIDAEMMIIPIEIPWTIGILALIVHTIVDLPHTPGALNVDPLIGAMAAGSGVGLVISIILIRKKLIAQSFAEGGPLLEFEKKEIEHLKQLASTEGLNYESQPMVEFSRSQIRQEMGKEMLFLIPPLVLGGLWMLACWRIAPLHAMWFSLMSNHPVSGFLGALWGGLVGAFAIWLTRILGSLFFGREAMGLGDVHLMFGVGAVIGATASVVVFFLAPFCGLIYALYKLFNRTGRELSYGPWLSLAAAIVVLFYCRVFEYLAPIFQGFTMAVNSHGN